MIGAGGAIVLRLLLATIATSLLAVPLVKLIGAWALIVIALNVSADSQRRPADARTRRGAPRPVGGGDGDRRRRRGDEPRQRRRPGGDRARQFLAARRGRRPVDPGARLWRPRSLGRAARRSVAGQAQRGAARLDRRRHGGHRPAGRRLDRGQRPGARGDRSGARRPVRLLRRPVGAAPGVGAVRRRSAAFAPLPPKPAAAALRAAPAAEARRRRRGVGETGRGRAEAAAVGAGGTRGARASAAGWRCLPRTVSP